MLQVDLLWTHPDPAAPAPRGRSFDDLFRDGGAWRRGVHEVADAAIVAARAQYRGPDAEGYGVAVQVSDRAHRVAMALDPGRSVLRGGA